MGAYTEERVVILREFGVKVARLRAERGSQEAFAHMDRVRLHRNEIGVVERGECEPGLLTLLILAGAFEDGSFWELLQKSPGASAAQAATAHAGGRGVPATEGVGALGRRFVAGLAVLACGSETGGTSTGGGGLGSA